MRVRVPAVLPNPVKAIHRLSQQVYSNSGHTGMSSLSKTRVLDCRHGHAQTPDDIVFLIRCDEKSDGFSDTMLVGISFLSFFELI